jgi:mannitol-1-phosphate 5-dehydrogenase
MKIAIQFGAGNIGRGFIGDLLKRSGYKIIFVEVNKELVEMLNEKGYYLLKLFTKDGKIKDLVIDNYLAVSLDKRDMILKFISQANIIFTAVGVKNLSNISNIIAEGLRLRFKENPLPLNIFLCENLRSAPEILKNEIIKYLNEDEKIFVLEKIGFVPTSIARMVGGSGKRYGFEDPLLIVTEDYDVIPYDAYAIKGNFPDVYGLKPSMNFNFEMEKKLFIHNLGHAVIAYFGYIKGYNYIHEAIKDDEIRKILNGVIEEITHSFFVKYKDIDKEEYYGYLKDLLDRLENPLLMDPIIRVAREPIRKLKPEDRIIGGANFCLSNGIFPENIAFTCACALLYNYLEDEEAKNLQDIINKNGVEWVLKNICNLSLEDNFSQKILFYYKEVKKAFRR